MSTKLTLNRREGVVAAQDVHLNRSVYSKPLVYSINDKHVLEGDFGYEEMFVLSVSGTVSSNVLFNHQKLPDTTEEHVNFTVRFQQNDLPTVSSSVVTHLLGAADWVNEHLNFTALFKERQLPLPVSTVELKSKAVSDASTEIQLYFNTIVLDKFLDTVVYKDLGYKESFDDPQN